MRARATFSPGMTRDLCSYRSECSSVGLHLLAEPGENVRHVPGA